VGLPCIILEILEGKCIGFGPRIQNAILVAMAVSVAGLQNAAIASIMQLSWGDNALSRAQMLFAQFKTFPMRTFGCEMATF